MDVFEKIHILTRELIPIFDELEDKTKEIVKEHVQDCSECEQLYSNVMSVENNYPKAAITNDVELKPLKKLVQFNRGLKLLFISIRVVILFYIIFSGFSFFDWELSAQAAVDYMQGVTLLFYFPAILFLNVFTITFFNKRWIFVSVLFDLMIILFIDRIFLPFL